MYIGEAISIGMCLDIVPFYEEDIKEFEKVNWLVLEKLYPVMRFEKIVFRADVDLSIAIEKCFMTAPNYYIDSEYHDYLGRKRYICPKPPNHKTFTTKVREDGTEYYMVDTLWELKHELDDSEARSGEPSWSFVVYIPEIEAERYCNRVHNDYDEVGRETTVDESLYYVLDINRYIKIIEGFKEY